MTSSAASAKTFAGGGSPPAQRARRWATTRHRTRRHEQPPAPSPGMAAEPPARARAGPRSAFTFSTHYAISQLGSSQSTRHSVSSQQKFAPLAPGAWTKVQAVLGGACASALLGASPLLFCGRPARRRAAGARAPRRGAGSGAARGAQAPGLRSLHARWKLLRIRGRRGRRGPRPGCPSCTMLVVIGATARGVARRRPARRQRWSTSLPGAQMSISSAVWDKTPSASVSIRQIPGLEARQNTQRLTRLHYLIGTSYQLQPVLRKIRRNRSDGARSEGGKKFY